MSDNIEWDYITPAEKIECADCGLVVDREEAEEHSDGSLVCKKCYNKLWEELK